MAIQTGNIISATEVAALVTKAKTMLGNRTLAITDTAIGGGTTTINLSTSSWKTAINADSTTGVAAGQSITVSGLNKALADSIKACVVINDIPNYLYGQNKGALIGTSKATTNLSTWLSNAKRDATGSSTAHGCRGACLGICTGGCTGGNKSGSSNSNNAYSCSGCCYSGCSECCDTGCNGGCLGACYLGSGIY